MKTKGVFWRYPRKISLLKDLREGYLDVFLLRKSMKTGLEFGCPSNISLLKDLAGGILGPGYSRVAKPPSAGETSDYQRTELAIAVIKQLMH
jgi:hypothetical protein